MSDGDTVAEAVANGTAAKADWIASMREAERPILPPGGNATESHSASRPIAAFK